MSILLTWFEDDGLWENLDGIWSFAYNFIVILSGILLLSSGGSAFHILRFQHLFVQLRIRRFIFNVRLFWTFRALQYRCIRVRYGCCSCCHWELLLTRLNNWLCWCNSRYNCWLISGWCRCSFRGSLECWNCLHTVATRWSNARPS